MVQEGAPKYAENDISRASAWNGADGHDTEFSSVFFAADHALYVDDETAPRS